MACSRATAGQFAAPGAVPCLSRTSSQSFFFSGLCSFLYANSLAKVRDAVPLIDYDTPL